MDNKGGDGRINLDELAKYEGVEPNEELLRAMLDQTSDPRRELTTTDPELPETTYRWEVLEELPEGRLLVRCLEHGSITRALSGVAQTSQAPWYIGSRAILEANGQVRWHKEDVRERSTATGPDETKTQQ